MIVVDGAETEREMAERHVREVAAHVARQREIVKRLPPSGEVAEIARTLLAEHEEMLSLMLSLGVV